MTADKKNSVRLQLVFLFYPRPTAKSAVKIFRLTRAFLLFCEKHLVKKQVVAGEQYKAADRHNQNRSNHCGFCISECGFSANQRFREICNLQSEILSRSTCRTDRLRQTVANRARRRRGDWRPSARPKVVNPGRSRGRSLGTAPAWPMACCPRPP